MGTRNVARAEERPPFEVQGPLRVQDAGIRRGGIRAALLAHAHHGRGGAAGRSHRGVRLALRGAQYPPPRGPPTREDLRRAGPAGTGAVQLQPPERSWHRDVFLPNIPNSRYDLDLLGADGFRQMAERRPKNPPFFRERIGEMTIRALSESNEHTETLSDNWMLSTLAHSGES